MGLMERAPKPGSVADADLTARYDARDLVRNGIKAEIVLDGQVYTLRITRSDKLILTK